MHTQRICYRRNYTHECFYRINPRDREIEFVYDFEENHKEIQSFVFSQAFVDELIQHFEAIDAQAYYCVRDYVADHLRRTPHRRKDTVFQYAPD